MNKALFFALALWAGLWGNPLSAQDVFQRANVFFQTYAASGTVDYAALSSRPEALRSMLYDIGRTSLHSRSVQYRTAFLINAFNALTIIQRAQSGKTRSAGSSDEVSHLVAGQQRTLREIKTELLQRGDWRIMLALACGEAGCPPVRAEAYIPDNLDRQLEDNARRLLNDPAYTYSDHGNRTLNVPGIFAGEQGLNGASEQEILRFINRFRHTPVPEDYSLGFGVSRPAGSTQEARPAGR